jgi:hypothetical protein
MKTGTIICITWLCFFTVHAQKTIEKHFDFSGKEALELNIQIADSINIQTWNKNEVYVKATVNINENKDNEAYLTSFEDKNGKVVVKANFRKDYFKGRNNCCNESDICWQVYIPEKSAFSVESINADITITGKTEKMNVKSISGYIDLALSERQSAELEFSTISGTIYSNHSLVQSGIKHGAHSAIEGKLNNGGPLIKLETISGDIFFRKSI